MRYKRMFPHIIFALLVGIFVFIQPSSTNKQILAVRETAKVMKVVDGDTIKVSLSGKKETVRLIGIDTRKFWMEANLSNVLGSKHQLRQSKY